MNDQNDEKTIQDVIDTMKEDQKSVLYYMVGQALENGNDVKHSDSDDEESDDMEELKPEPKNAKKGTKDKTIKAVIDSMTEEQ